MRYVELSKIFRLVKGKDKNKTEEKRFGWEKVHMVRNDVENLFLKVMILQKIPFHARFKPLTFREFH